MVPEDRKDSGQDQSGSQKPTIEQRRQQTRRNALRAVARFGLEHNWSLSDIRRVFKGPPRTI